MDCLSIDILVIVRYLKVAVNVIRVLIPVALIISIMLSLFKAVASDEEGMKKALKTNANKIIATVVIFLLPPIVNFTLTLISDNTTFDSCWVNAEKENINKLAVAQAYEQIEALNEESNLSIVSDIQSTIAYIDDETIRNNYTSQLNTKVQAISKSQSQSIHYNVEYKTQIVTPQMSGGPGPVDDKITYGKNAEGNYVVGNTSLVTINTSKSSIGCTLKYGTSTLTKLQVNTAIKDQMEDILKDTCSYVNSYSYAKNTNYVHELGTAGTYNSGSSYSYPHAYALGIDLNNNWTYKYNGKTYSPYSLYANSSNYRKFICEVCNGDETCPQNINYHIYEEYFKPYGWCWGGYWGESNFDPMHFEYKRPWANSCSTSNKITMNCN